MPFLNPIERITTMFTCMKPHCLWSFSPINEFREVRASLHMIFSVFFVCYYFQHCARLKPSIRTRLMTILCRLSYCVHPPQGVVGRSWIEKWSQTSLFPQTNDRQSLYTERYKTLMCHEILRHNHAKGEGLMEKIRMLSSARTKKKKKPF